MSVTAFNRRRRELAAKAEEERRAAEEARLREAEEADRRRRAEDEAAKVRAEARKPYEKLTAEELREIAKYSGLEGAEDLNKGPLIDAMIEAGIGPIKPPADPPGNVDDKSGGDPDGADSR